jgi:acid stress-induced BolA-like protein IbaG/YrbA
MSTQDMVAEALRIYFGDARLKLETGPNGRVYGAVVSGSFGGQDDETRQDQVWTALRRKMGEGELNEVTLVLAFTPEEAEALDGDAA